LPNYESCTENRNQPAGGKIAGETCRVQHVRRVERNLKRRHSPLRATACDLKRSRGAVRKIQLIDRRRAVAEQKELRIRKRQRVAARTSCERHPRRGTRGDQK